MTIGQCEPRDIVLHLLGLVFLCALNGKASVQQPQQHAALATATHQIEEELPQLRPHLVALSPGEGVLAEHADRDVLVDVVVLGLGRGSVLHVQLQRVHRHVLLAWEAGLGKASLIEELP